MQVLYGLRLSMAYGCHWPSCLANTEYSHHYAANVFLFVQALIACHTFICTKQSKLLCFRESLNWHIFYITLHMQPFIDFLLNCAICQV